MKKITKNSMNKSAVRPVVSLRMKKSRYEKLKEVCKKNKVSHCKMAEVLIEKFLRGEIIIFEKDFEI